jgi:UDP-N-acetyl-D-mannosaminuronic acid dehydrogenase
MSYDVCIVGGCGHVGLPLALCFAKEGKRVAIFDINEQSVAAVAAGQMPFLEEGAESLLNEALAKSRLFVTSSAKVVAESEVVVFILGTPLDAHLNPSLSAISRAIRQCLPYLKDGQLIILRSTVYPGTSEKIDRLLKNAGLKVDLAFCPERVLEGQAIRETYELPQIVSAFSEEGLQRARELFSTFTDDIIELAPLEAELVKLYSNTWRYISFAVANQFFTIANDQGLDYYRIRDAMMHNYPRAKDLPKAGFAAGPCLFKDTMQLAAFHNNNFFLGHAAMLVNEGLPAYIVEVLKQRYPIENMTVGILGMAFKAGSDDSRESLSYKLRKILEHECLRVLIADPYVEDERIVPAEDVIAGSDIVVIGAPHAEYQDLDFQGRHLVDIWNLLGNGSVV